MGDIPQAHNGFPFVFRQIIGEPGEIQYASGQGDIFLGDIPQIHDSPPFTYRESVGEPRKICYELGKGDVFLKDALKTTNCLPIILRPI